MQLYIDSYGAFLRVRNKMFEVTVRENPPTRFSTEDVDVIVMTEGVGLTTDAMALALEHDVPIVLINYTGYPIGRVWSGRFGSISTIRRNQAFFCVQSAGWEWMARQLSQKIERQRETCLGLSERFAAAINPIRLDKKTLDKIARAASSLDGLAKKLGRWTWPAEGAPLSEIANEFRASEATASRMYFRSLSAAMPDEKWAFDNRNFRPARDRFNCLLNYLYGALYVQVELALVKVGIDPALGVLHIDRHQRSTFTYDFIEPFRHWADQVALQIAADDAAPDEGFDALDSLSGDLPEYRLNRLAKTVAIDRFLTLMNEKTPYKNKQQRRQTILEMEAQQLATFLKTWNPTP